MRLFITALSRWILPAVLIAWPTVADKDSDYYPPGMTNPNLKTKMYWKDSINVLQDLDQFESLYIQYHGCVWSKYGSRYGSGQNYDEQVDKQNGDDDQQNNENVEQHDTACGGWGGEHFWYMGRTQCFKANVAYSLYGILKTSSKSLEGSPCQESTYINSFFSTFGVESFSGPLGLGTDDANSQCTAEEPDDASEVENYSYYQSDDDYLDDAYYFYNWESYTSYGTGCSAEGTFVQDSYQGAFCKGRKFVETLDKLDDLNANLQAMQCTQIYASDENNGYNGRDYTDDDLEFDNMNAIDILSFSKSCSLRQYPNDCPDPYGLKKVYAKKKASSIGIHKTTERLLNIGSYIFLALGLGCWGAAYMVTRQSRRERADARKVSEIEMKKTTSSDSTAKDDEHFDSDGNELAGMKNGYGFEYVRTVSLDKKKKHKKAKKTKPHAMPASITIEPTSERQPSSRLKNAISLPRFLSKKQDPVA